MLRLPWEYRLSQGLVGDIISSAWPELLSLPYRPKNPLVKLKHFLRHFYLGK